MNNLTTFDINKFTPYAVGFDRVFDRLWDHAHNMHTSTGFPPYNIVKESNVKWRIELALAGWSRDDIEVTTESNVLIIKSKSAKEENSEEYMHRGVASRTFARGFNLSDDVEVGEVKFVNGMLIVDLKRIIPDHQKLKTYDIE